MPTKIVSFGYKYGTHDNAIDVRRILPNPYHREGQHGTTGLDPRVQKFFWGFPQIHVWLDTIALQVSKIDGPAYIGCVGGKHRSVFAAEDMARRFKVPVEHLDIDKP